jgi:hypothetical protein
MRYLHGDSHPFSLNENFLETLCAATDACVALIGAEVAADNARRVMDESDACVAAENARLETLGGSVGAALDAHGVGETPSNVTEAAAKKILLLAHQALVEARGDVVAWRDATVAAANASVPAVLPVLGAFLVKHQLPNTTWELTWSAGRRGAPARAQALGGTRFGLSAVYDIGLPASHLWAQPVRVALLAQAVAIPMMRKTLFGGSKVKDIRLDKYFVTQVTHTTERASLVLSETSKDGAPGIEILLRGPNPTGAATATPIDADGKQNGEIAVLTGNAAQAVQRLWERVESTIADLVWFRRALRSATFEGGSVSEHRYPALIAKRIIEATAPLVREMREHSRTPGELALKRDLGDGKREEMFISHSDVSRRYASVPPRFRTMFDAFGLEEVTNIMLHKPAPPASPKHRKLPPPRTPSMAMTG